MGTGRSDDAPPNSLQGRERPTRLGRGPLAHAATENCNVSASGVSVLNFFGNDAAEPGT